jgi:hypothetical protein
LHQSCVLFAFDGAMKCRTKSTTFLNLTCISVVHRLCRPMRNVTYDNLLTRPLRVAEAKLLHLLKYFGHPALVVLSTVKGSAF